MKVGFKDDKKKYQVGKSKVFMKEECRQVLEVELGRALIEHTIIIQRGMRKSLFRKKINRVISCRFITRSFHKLHLQNKLTALYSLKYLKSKQVIVKAFRRYLKNKREAEFRQIQKENEDKELYDQKYQEIEEERKRLDELREKQKDELNKLDTKMSSELSKDFDFDNYNSNVLITEESSRYSDFLTPGNPDENGEEFKYHNDAFKEEFEDLSDYMDNEEVNTLQNKIEELETQVSIYSPIKNYRSVHLKMKEMGSDINL